VQGLPGQDVRVHCVHQRPIEIEDQGLHSSVAPSDAFVYVPMSSATSSSIHPALAVRDATTPTTPRVPRADLRIRWILGVVRFAFRPGRGIFG
jgi:hypothetical protein